MASTNDILQDIIDHLSKHIDNLAIEPYPEGAEQGTYRLNHPVGALLVGYEKSDYGKPVDTGFVIQERTVTGFVDIVARQLNGNDGTNTLVDLVASLLIGHRVKDAKPIVLEKDAFIREISGQWHHRLNFQLVTIAQEQWAENNTPFTKANYDET